MAHAASIIIPVYNAMEAAASCLESVYRARTDIPFEVIAVDNGSDRPFDEYLGPARTRYQNFRVVRFQEPLGFARAANEGARPARHDYLVLLNSDTLVAGGWLDNLMRALTEDPAIAVVSPVTNRCGHDAQVERNAVSLEASQTAEFAASIGNRSGILFEPQALSFFCVMIRRTVWERLGGLDEIYRTGNFEDNDFCLRVRLAGYRLAIVPSVFVYHAANQTFEANRLDHSELLARNGAVFLERASRWSRTVPPTTTASTGTGPISVIVPVLPSTLRGVHDSLASLCNQTISGFETVLIHPADLDVAPSIAAASRRLQIVTRTVPGTPDGPAALLNAGLAAARGRRICYLPAGDIFFPYHLEVLSQELDRFSLDAAYCAWSVHSQVRGTERRGAISFDQAEPMRLPWGDWAPLACWMHERAVTPPGGFDVSFVRFPGWQFVRRLSSQVRYHYARRVTVELHLPAQAAPSDSCAVAEAERISGAPSGGWQHRHREDFLEAVRKGSWQHHLVIDRNQVERRARRLVGGSGLARFEAAQMEALRAKLETVPKRIVPSSPSALPNIFLFSIIEWNTLTQRPQHFARGLAKRGYRVIWVDVRLNAPRMIDPDRLTSELAPGLHYLELPGTAAQIYSQGWSPAVLDLMTLVIERVSNIHPAESAIQLVTFPKWTPLATRLRDCFGWPIIYDCLDDQQAFAELYKHDASEFEDQLIGASSVLITAAHSLFDRYQSRHSNTKLLPNAADYETFHNARPGGFLDRLSRPVIGFFGAFSDWLDLDWIADSALSFPDWSFVYIGLETFATSCFRERWRTVIAAPNITVLPQMDLPHLASHLAEFDVCTMPFQDLPVTRAMNPVKIYEYLAAGKPVVAPDLPETRPFAEQGLIAVYASREESFRLLRDAVSRSGTPSQIAARFQFAAANSWSERLDSLISVFENLRC